jgi:hypothetical protein
VHELLLCIRVIILSRNFENTGNAENPKNTKTGHQDLMLSI